MFAEENTSNQERDIGNKKETEYKIRRYLIPTLNKNYQGHEIKYDDMIDSCHVQQKKGNAYQLK